ncbi:PilZ domain-containing protein [Desulforegula conservatrix]|uniref:PilZ domain-containing protein n=1 Tax=Desulforegula conservatrix TaxID=153026 RepID=UPI000487E6C3|nr:PilZ domain-containing protein [Desulforegula conservatrix]
MKTKYRQLTMERRSTRRYPVKEGMYAAFKSGRLLVGTIDNFCKGGLCFRYLDDLESASDDRSGELTLFSYNHGFFLDNIKCRIVRDEADNSDPSFIDISMKTLAVEFNDLDSYLSQGISDFINNFCIINHSPGHPGIREKREENHEYNQYMKYMRAVNI